MIQPYTPNPCPVCGSRRANLFDMPNMRTGKRLWWIGCETCHYQTPMREGRCAAERTWNGPLAFRIIRTADRGGFRCPVKRLHPSLI